MSDRRSDQQQHHFHYPTKSLFCPRPQNEETRRMLIRPQWTAVRESGKTVWFVCSSHSYESVLLFEHTSASEDLGCSPVINHGQSLPSELSKEG